MKDERTYIKLQPPAPDHSLDHHSQESLLYVDHGSQARIGIDAYPDRLHVLTMLENPTRSRTRYANYWKFAKHVEDSGAYLYTAEIAFENRNFEVTDPSNPRHLQLRTPYEYWHKENALNLLTARLPPDAEKLAFFDADITFVRPDWAQEILHGLAHYDVLQPFSEAMDVGPDSQTLYGTTPSFMHQYINHGVAPHEPSFMAEFPHLAKSTKFDGSQTIQVKPPDNEYGRGLVTRGGYWHPGLAWCWRKSALNIAGGLMDWLPTGSGDWHMANALIGNLTNSLDPKHTESYKRWCWIWQDRVKEIRDNPSGGVGYIDGLLLHSYHGAKKKRSYDKRHLFVLQTEFDPDLDLKKDHQGLWQLTGRQPKLRDGLRAYARMRNEDDVNMDWLQGR